MKKEIIFILTCFILTGIVSASGIIQPSSVEPFIVSECADTSKCIGTTADVIDGDISTYWYPSNYKAYAKITYPELIEGDYNIYYQWKGDTTYTDCYGEISVSSDDKTYSILTKDKTASELNSINDSGSFKYLKVKVGGIKVGTAVLPCGLVTLYDVYVTQGGEITTEPVVEEETTETIVNETESQTENNETSEETESSNEAGFFSKLFCKIFHPFNGEKYSQCLQ